MSGGIYLIQGDEKLVKMEEQPYDSEDLLQKLLADYPNLLAGDQTDDTELHRFLLVSREMSLSSEEDSSGRWLVDHLFLDQDAIPTIVEVKRSSNTQIRREVVGQMLDYTANAVVYWPVESLRTQFETNREDPEQELAEFLESNTELEEFWQKVKTNLQAGRVRLIFVADIIPAELRRIVEFLNNQMDPAEVLAVEIRQYVGEGLQALVPRLIGQTVEPPPRPISDKGQAYRAFFQMLIDRLRQEHPDFTGARKGLAQNWYYFASGFAGIQYALVFAQGKRVRAEVYIDRGDAESNKALFDSLAEQKDLLSVEFGEELEWERLDNRRASRIAVYREGSIEDDQQKLEEITEWSINRLLKLK